MKTFLQQLAVLIMALSVSFMACSESVNPNEQKPSQKSGKADTGYISLRGVEVEMTIEGDVESSQWNVFQAPAYIAQFAVTYLRSNRQIYVELLTEDVTAPDRVEWLVDGNWLAAAEAKKVDFSKLTHFRIPVVNTILYDEASQNVSEGKVYKAKVPQKPYSIYTDAKDTCADPDSHLGLDQSVYWYLWNPDKSGCKAPMQELALTVTKVLPQNPPSYPEYDRLWADKKLTAVVLFGQADDKVATEKDINYLAAQRFAQFLKDNGFAEVNNAPVGKRFSKQAGENTYEVDLYYPKDFENLTDYSHLDNWQRAVSEHEVVIYLGHSILGTSSAFDDVKYPDFYQIFLVGSCLSYEYYVRPLLEGKKGWDNVDALSNVVETYFSDMPEIAKVMLKKLWEGFENGGKITWQDILKDINEQLWTEFGTFGVSGARDNRFVPGQAPVPPVAEMKYASDVAKAIPDNDANGITSSIQVSEEALVETITVEFEISHSFAADLVVVLTHGGVETVLWDKQWSDSNPVQLKVVLDQFKGLKTNGEWTLQVIDQAAVDTGSLTKWALNIAPKN